MMGFLHCVGVTQLVSEFLSERIVSYVVVDILCSWKEVRSEGSYVSILNCNPY